MGTVLVDGFVGGTWRISRDRGGATLNVQLFKRLPRADAAALRAEGERLLAFAAPEGPAHRVKIGVA